jgi:hypothetical protein
MVRTYHVSQLEPWWWARRSVCGPRCPNTLAFRARNGTLRWSAYRGPRQERSRPPLRVLAGYDSRPGGTRTCLAVDVALPPPSAPLASEVLPCEAFVPPVRKDLIQGRSTTPLGPVLRGTAGPSSVPCECIALTSSARVVTSALRKARASSLRTVNGETPRTLAISLLRGPRATSAAISRSLRLRPTPCAQHSKLDSTVWLIMASARRI